MAFTVTTAANSSICNMLCNNGVIYCSAVPKRNLPSICSRHQLAPEALRFPTANAQLQSRNSRNWMLHAVSGSGGISGGGSSGGGGGSGGGGSSGGGSSSGGGGGEGAGAHPMRLWTWLYAALLAGGGTMGYIKKGSVKSLTSSLGAALILSLSARSMIGPQVKGSLAVCLAITILLSIVMSGRYSRTKKLMPAGITAGVSLAMSAAYLGFLFQ